MKEQYIFSESSYINTNDTDEQFRFLSVAKVYIRSLRIRSLSLVARNSFLADEPRCEKTGIRGFRPGPTQTGQYNYRICLDA